MPLWSSFSSSNMPHSLSPRGLGTHLLTARDACPLLLTPTWHPGCHLLRKTPPDTSSPDSVRSPLHSRDSLMIMVIELFDQSPSCSSTEVEYIGHVKVGIEGLEQPKMCLRF